MTNDELKQRTRAVPLRIIRKGDSLPRHMSAEVLGRQLMRSATSVAANYRSSSRAGFISKMGTVEAEADESALWLELIGEAALVSTRRLAGLMQEAQERTPIAGASMRAARRSTTPPSALCSPQLP